MIKIFENLDLQDFDGEIWKVIKDFPDYSVSNLGRVKSFKKYRRTNENILKQHKNYKYFFIVLQKNRKDKYKKVHILVYETFNDYKLKSDECVHHIDFTKENNCLENLIVMSKKEHNLLHNKGENNPNFGKHHSKETKIKIGKNNPNKLTNQKITNIKIDIEKENLTQVEIAKKHGVCQMTVSNIKNGKILIN
jgi:hypothetical protein